MKAPRIREEEQADALAAYDRARAVYDRIAAESLGDEDAYAQFIEPLARRGSHHVIRIQDDAPLRDLTIADPRAVREPDVPVLLGLEIELLAVADLAEQPRVEGDQLGALGIALVLVLGFSAVELGAALASGSGLAAIRTEGNPWFPSVTSFPFGSLRSLNRPGASASRRADP